MFRTVIKKVHLSQLTRCDSSRFAVASKSNGNVQRRPYATSNSSSIADLLHGGENQLTGGEILVVNKLFDGLMSGARASLAQTITLVESSHPRKKLQARLLLSKALTNYRAKLNGNSKEGQSFRIGWLHISFCSLPSISQFTPLFWACAGLSGPPGAGKSTFLEHFGKYLTGKGEKMAVLAVDPSSTTTGGKNFLQIIHETNG